MQVFQWNLLKQNSFWNVDYILKICHIAHFDINSGVNALEK